MDAPHDTGRRELGDALRHGHPAVVSHVRARHGPGLDEAVERLVEPFGGWTSIVAPGERVAVKVNLLRAAPPEKAVTTHPETLGCVLRALKAAGTEPFVADSPGGRNGPAKVARAYKLSGIADVCAAEGVQIVDVEDDRSVLAAPEGRLYRSFAIGRAFKDADAVVQVGVLKTHQLMRLTGGVKLTYGVVPGLAKAHLHVKAQRREDFADMLLDLHLALRPRFTIIDGILAMEGQGPGSGSPRELGSLFAARDCLALDAALADRTAHPRERVYTVAASARRGLLDLADPYRVAGDPIEPDTGFTPVQKDLQVLLPRRCIDWRASSSRPAPGWWTPTPASAATSAPPSAVRARSSWTRCRGSTTPPACAASPVPRCAPRRRSTMCRRCRCGSSRLAADGTARRFAHWCCGTRLRSVVSPPVVISRVPASAPGRRTASPPMGSATRNSSPSRRAGNARLPAP